MGMANVIGPKGSNQPYDTIYPMSISVDYGYITATFDISGLSDMFEVWVCFMLSYTTATEWRPVTLTVCGAVDSRNGYKKLFRDRITGIQMTKSSNGIGSVDNTASPTVTVASGVMTVSAYLPNPVNAFGIGTVINACACVRI